MDDTSSKQQIFSVIQQIPMGRVATYGQVAELAGLHGCARMVGRTLSQLPAESKLPWHRVVAASGKISLPSDNTSFSEQKSRLELEHIKINGTRINLRIYQWNSLNQ